MRKRIIHRRRERLEAFFELHAARLPRQGALVASYRARGALRLGPYYKLTCRDDAGRQRAAYLGADSPLVAEVSRRLSELQAPLRTRRIIDQARRAARRFQAAANTELDQQLKRVGLYRKGSEIRGWAQASLPSQRPVRSEDQASSANQQTATNGSCSSVQA